MRGGSHLCNRGRPEAEGCPILPPPQDSRGKPRPSRRSLPRPEMAHARAEGQKARCGPSTSGPLLRHLGSLWPRQRPCACQGDSGTQADKPLQQRGIGQPSPEAHFEGATAEEAVGWGAAASLGGQP